MSTDKPDVEAKVAQLEARVKVLEDKLLPRPSDPVPVRTSEQIRMEIDQRAAAEIQATRLAKKQRLTPAQVERLKHEVEAERHERI